MERVAERAPRAGMFDRHGDLNSSPSQRQGHDYPMSDQEDAMHNQSHSRNQVLHRLMTIPAAALAACLFVAPAMAQSFQVETPAVPILKGAYVLTDMQLCISGKGQSSQITGRATFDPTSGTLKLDGYIATGDPLLLNPLKQRLSYSNSATTITLGDTVYQVTYGKLDKGIATYLSFIAAVDPCAAQIWLSRQ
jgi:hypothetical protein